MTVCDACGNDVALPFKCKYCGGTFCSDHRLPEKHSCKEFSKALSQKMDESKSQEIVERAEVPEVKIRYEIRPFRPRKFRVFRSLFKQASIVIIFLIFVVFIAQLVIFALSRGGYYTKGDHNTFLYYTALSRSTVLLRPWTLITHIFMHDVSYPMVFLHMPVNVLVFLSFGPLLEAMIGRRRFLLLFFGSGIIAGVAQILVIPSETVALGASGAILGVLGTLTVLAPRLPVLFFIIPMRLWTASLIFGVLSVLMALFGIGGTIGHAAHLTGLIIGLIYGYKLLREKRKEYRFILRFSSPWA